MLYYILPPVVIILGTTALIFFLFRKVAEFPGSDQLLQRAEGEGMVRTGTRALFAKVGQMGLKILERTMHRFKLMSLKFHNTSNDWFHTIRKKREESMKAGNGANADPIEHTGPHSANSEPIENDRQEMYRKKQPRPLLREVSAGAARGNGPAAVGEKKNQLEEVLIKRIAINPRDIEAYERLGDYYLEQLNLRDSLECYKQVSKLSPTHFKARSKIRKIERMLKQ